MHEQWGYTGHAVPLGFLYKLHMLYDQCQTSHIQTSPLRKLTFKVGFRLTRGCFL